MAEYFGWLFVDSVPLLYEKKRVARQFQVEMWLDPSRLIKSLKIEHVNANRQSTCLKVDYVV